MGLPGLLAVVWFLENWEMLRNRLGVEASSKLGGAGTVCNERLIHAKPGSKFSGFLLKMCFNISMEDIAVFGQY